MINEKPHKSLKWLSDKKLQNFSYRVVFESDNPRHNHAIYLSEWKEALKIRDFSIVAAISDNLKNKSIPPKEFIKKFATLWKTLHAYKILKLIRIYLEKENERKKEISKRLKKEEEKKIEQIKEKTEEEKKMQMEEEIKLKYMEKIRSLKNSESLNKMNVEIFKYFIHYWFSIAKNTQTVYLNSKPGNLFFDI